MGGLTDCCHGNDGLSLQKAKIKELPFKFGQTL